jgi:cysteine-rich repeat protein
MKFVILALLFVLATPAYAATFNCEVPAPYLTRGQELCEELRVKLRYRVADWTMDRCASLFLRIGLKQGDRVSTQTAGDEATRTAVTTAKSDFATNFPVPGTPAVCGDGTTDAEFGEECDDGGTAPGDGCDHLCKNEP